MNLQIYTATTADFYPQKLNVYVLSVKIMNNHLLWAHYADGFKGICIAVTFKGDGFARAEEIEYVPTRPVFFEKIGNDIDAIEALSLKWPHWEHENEVRLFTDSNRPFIDAELEVCEVYFGLRTSQIHKQVIKKMLPSNIPYFDTQFNFQTSTIEVIRRKPYPKQPEQIESDLDETLTLRPPPPDIPYESG